ncbi:transmembrane protein 200A-like [Protopterus annectens]|uniref:transmembrane protein 200A-like n=1 Tax=Protopterus annectens TaxID=7888 RepID=UPI001CFB16B8|nr:transmembrane protein 200A-like [Protopterus annectens]XP_043940910.1 transmembrane protein 200A-like [Protopterus annectens]XP_043940918.1 transmembrane protein 200A-like [Protopterus annectens]
MKNQELYGKNRISSTLRRKFWHLKRKSPKDGVVKGQIRMKSPSGAFVVLGVAVVIVGMIIAIVGYWPQKGHQLPRDNRMTNSNDTVSYKKEVGLRPIMTSPSSQNNDKLKLIGPVIMGFGLFIFICANTMLYENRDKETQMLAQKNIQSMMSDLQLNSNENRHYQWRTNPSADDVKIQFLEHGYNVDPPSSTLQSCHSPGSKWVDCNVPNKLQMTAQLLHHKDISPSISLHSIRSDSCNSSEGNIHIPLNCGAESIASSTINALALPVIKLNNCIIENPGISKVVDDEEAEIAHAQSPVAVLRHSWNFLPSFSGNSGEDNLTCGHIFVNLDSLPLEKHSPSKQVSKLLSPQKAKKEFSSDVQLSTAGQSTSFDLGQGGNRLVAPAEEQKNRSWPRLECTSVKRYMKLENREDSSEKLLEQNDSQDNNKKHYCENYE